MIKILLPIWIVSWLILLPVDAAGTSVTGKTGLDKFTFGNVSASSQARYGAHLVVAWLATGEYSRRVGKEGGRCELSLFERRDQLILSSFFPPTPFSSSLDLLEPED